MQLYAILRRNGWRTAADLEAAAQRSTATGDEMPEDIRWIRSYVLSESNGSVGTVCIYQATSPTRSSSTQRRQACRSTRSSPSPTP